MCSIVWGLVALVLSFTSLAEAAMGPVLTQAGDAGPPNWWCNNSANKIARGTSVRVGFTGRTGPLVKPPSVPGLPKLPAIPGRPVPGTIRMLTQTDKFEWASGVPIVTFPTSPGNLGSFPVTAKSTAPLGGPYVITFAGVDPSGILGPTVSCQFVIVSPYVLTLGANPPSGATSNTSLTLSAVEQPGWFHPESRVCGYHAISAAGVDRYLGYSPTCATVTATLAAGTYKLQVGYRFPGPDGLYQDGLSEIANYVVAAATGGGTAVSFTNDLYPVYSHIRCVNCHGRADPPSGRNHPPTSAACSTCHTVPGWTDAGAPSFWAGTGSSTQAKSASDICNTVKGSGRASSRATFLQHVGTDYLQGAPTVQNPDQLIQWSFAPTAPVESPPGGVTSMAYTNFGKKSMQWFDAGKPCP